MTAPESTPPTPPTPPRRASKVRRGPILLVVIAAVVAAAIVQQGAPSTGSGAASATALHAGVSVPPSAAASSAWYCAEGTSAASGRADETVDVTITVMPGGDAASKSQQLRLAPREETRVRVADILAVPEPGVVVEAAGGPTAVSQELDHGDDVDVLPCTRSAGPDWYFASGTTVEGSEHDLVLFNPFGDDAIVDVTFLTDTGVQQPDALQAVVVPRRSRITIPVQNTVLRQAQIATFVHARVGRLVAAQTQIFDGTVPDSGPTRTGMAVSLGAQSPATAWRIPGGTTQNGGVASLSLANFSGADARVAVHVVMVGDQHLPPQTLTIPARSVVDTDVTMRVPLGTAYAVTVTSLDQDGRSVPVVAQLLASWAPASSTPGVAATVGTPIAARRWVVPRTGVDADAFVTVVNPGGAPVTAAMLPASAVDRRTGPSSEPELAIAPGAAQVLQLPSGSESGGAWVITAQHPIVVGLTALGTAGASISTAIPDPSYAG